MTLDIDIPGNKIQIVPAFFYVFTMFQAVNNFVL